MWQPISLRIKNLMTHEDTTFNFKRNKCIMIFGINSSDAGADSNGGGKSTILEGMTLSLTGETNRDVSKDEFIRDGEDECFIQMELTNEVGDVNHLEIKRWFFRKKSAKIEIWENGSQNKEISSVNEANKRVFELIGLNKEDLLHFFMVGQETSYSFLTAGDNDKKDIISRFSNINFINDKIEELKVKKKNSESNLSLIEKEYQKHENKLEFLNEQKSDLLENFESENKEKIEEINQKISKEKKKKIEKKNEIDEIESKIKSLKIKVSKIEIEDDSDLKSKLEKIKQKIRQNESDISDAEHTISHLEAIYEGKVTCPSCSHEFNPAENIDISEIPTLLNQSNEILLSLESTKSKLKKSKKDIEDKIELNSDKKDEVSELNRKIKRLQSDLDISQNEYKNFDKKIKSLTEEISEIKNTSIDSKIKEIDDNIKKHKNLLNEVNEQKSKIDDEILDYDFWIYHFGKKGLLTFLTNKSIKSIEGITNSYLKQMNSELQILIDGYTVLKTGDLREKINISIIRNGLQVANFNRYSGGEKGRIKLANILGLQHLINLTAKNGGLNFLGLDEVFEGLDRTGQIDVLNILENLKVTSLVITHRNQPIGASNEIFIEKIGGISRIVDKKFLNLPHEKSIKSKIRKIRK